ncbi:uncharacterized protein PG986_004972 [Apiospora aurea]|uniref:Uncharacterized protein n=1 Tax=Apiospora aurea TaxID=335848 RepID=A0ABR1QGI1_9PEZI
MAWTSSPCAARDIKKNEAGDKLTAEEKSTIEQGLFWGKEGRRGYFSSHLESQQQKDEPRSQETGPEPTTHTPAMDSSQDSEQPAMTPSNPWAVRDIKAGDELPRAPAHLSPREWLALSEAHGPKLTRQTRQLISSVASLQIAMDAVSHLVNRRHRDRLSASSSSSSASSGSASTVVWPNLQELAQTQQLGLRNFCDLLKGEVDEEIQEAALEQSRRELAKQKLKEDEEKGIQVMQQLLGLTANGTDSDGRPKDLGRSKSALEVAAERAKSLTQGPWTKPW